MGYTALHTAASHGHFETTKVLLRAGASLTCECQGSLRTTATGLQRAPIIRRARVTPLHIAAARRNVPMCRAMLQAHVRLHSSATNLLWRHDCVSLSLVRYQGTQTRINGLKTFKLGQLSVMPRFSDVNPIWGPLEVADGLHGWQALHARAPENAAGGGQPVADIRNIRDHYEQRPVDIAEALHCPALAAMLNPNLPLSLATIGHGFHVRLLALQNWFCTASACEHAIGLCLAQQ